MPESRVNPHALRPADSRTVRSLQVIAAALLLMLLTGCQTTGISFLDPAGPIAAMQRHWFFLLLGGLVLVALPVLVGVPFCLWRYRADNRKATFRPGWDFSLPLEFLVWGTPAIVVIAFSLLIWGPERRFSPEYAIGEGTPLTVDVVALNWKWLFIYPDYRIATLDRLVIPQGREILFRLTSDATMQSFLVPSLGGQIYAMAGMVTRLHLRADREGRYLGENTQFNGMGFQDQKFPVDVVSQARFSQWIDSASSSPLHLDTATYAVIRRDATGRQTAHTLQPGSHQTTLSFSGVSGSFFQTVVDRYSKPDDSAMAGNRKSGHTGPDGGAAGRTPG